MLRVDPSAEGLAARLFLVWGAGEDEEEEEEEEEEKPQAEPSTIHPTASSNIQNSWPSWGFSLGSMVHAPSPTGYLKESKADVQGSQKK